MSGDRVNPDDLPRSHPFCVLRGLMLAENFGDVHDEINLLHDHFGLPRPEGNFLDGWTDSDWRAVGFEPEDDDE